MKKTQSPRKGSQAEEKPTEQTRQFVALKATGFFSPDNRKTIPEKAVKEELQTVQTSLEIDENDELIRAILVHLALYLNVKNKIDEKINCLVIDKDTLDKLISLKASQEFAKIMQTLVDDLVKNIYIRHFIPAYKNIKKVSLQSAGEAKKAITEAVLNEFRIAGIHSDKNTSISDATLAFSKLNAHLKEHIDETAYDADLKNFKALLEPAQKQKIQYDQKLNKLKEINFEVPDSGFVSQKDLVTEFCGYLSKKYHPRKIIIDQKNLEEVMTDSLSFLRKFSNDVVNTNPLLKNLSIKEEILIYFNNENFKAFFEQLNSQLKLVVMKKSDLIFEYKKDNKKLESAIKTWADSQFKLFKKKPSYVRVGQTKKQVVSGGISRSKERLSGYIGRNVYRESIKPKEKVTFEEGLWEFNSFMIDGEKTAELETKVLKYEKEYEDLKKQISQISSCSVIGKGELQSLQSLEKQKAFYLTMQLALKSFVENFWEKYFFQVCDLYKLNENKDYLFIINFIAQAVINEFGVVDMDENNLSEEYSESLDLDELPRVLKNSILTDINEYANRKKYIDLLRNFRGLLQQAKNQKLFSQDSSQQLPHTEYKRQFKYFDDKNFIDYEKIFVDDKRLLDKMTKQSFVKGMNPMEVINLIKESLAKIGGEKKFSAALAFKSGDPLFLHEKHLSSLFESLNSQIMCSDNELTLKDKIEAALITWLTSELNLAKEDASLEVTEYNSSIANVM